MAGVKAANLGLKFVLELAAIAAFAYWGASHSPVVLAVILAGALPALFTPPGESGRRRGRAGGCPVRPGSRSSSAVSRSRRWR